MPSIHPGFTQGPDGRWLVWCKDRTYKLWTRIVARNILGRDLKYSEIVHHVDENTGNDTHDNLVICTRKYHDSVLHADSRSGGRPAEKTCKTVLHIIMDLYSLGYSQYRIADVAGISQPYVSRLLSGKRGKYCA